MTNSTTNECKPQTEINKQNGAKCENGGYTLMEQELHYKRLLNPPKGKGLDGLFEKDGDMISSPDPMPDEVNVPVPGSKLVFVPPDKRPPLAIYDYAPDKDKPAKRTYPKYVVFEAKNIDKFFDPTDTDGITKEARNRLKNTCDGMQLSTPWTEKRIPQALGRDDSLVPTTERRRKQQDINRCRYARWLFACLPGSVGRSTKLYVLIDILAKGLDLESTPPKPRKPRKPNKASSDDGIGSVD